MKKRKDLPQTQLYNSIYAPVQTFENYENKSKNDEIDDLINLKRGKILNFFAYLWKKTFSHFAEEWSFLAILGILVALISYMIDKASLACNNARIFLYNDIAEFFWERYFAWISIPVLLIAFGAGFVHLISPKAAGSGIPEIKTILRGIPIDSFLTFPTLLAKIVGLVTTLGSNLPLGKEGPLIHISSIIASLMGKFVYPQEFYQNETRKMEILGAACAVGVACCFAAPIGGVLLSVEITTAYYAVRNYWRGFCAAVWAAVIYRLMYVWIDNFESVTVVFKSSIFVDTPFAAQELLVFAVLGVICGFGGAFYMKMHRNYSQYQRDNQILKTIRKSNFFIYPVTICLIVSSTTFPMGIGKFLAGQVPAPQQFINLFSNFTWINNNLTISQQKVVNNWKTKETGLYLHLICYIAYNFICSIIATTIPIPNGCLSPSLRMGAAIGRILGESMHFWYPNGLSYHGRITKIMPGGYAIVGAAAFAGAVTQTMSICVIILEMTNQITHVLPILIAVLISNAISQVLGPSVYNSVIKVKNLPYLPDLLPRNCDIYNICVEDFMSKNLNFIYNNMTWEELIIILRKNRKLNDFPLINDRKNMILLGSIHRKELIKRIYANYLIKKPPKCPTRLDQIHKTHLDNSKFTLNPLYEAPIALNKRNFDFSSCCIDPAPFQLVEKTSLLKVHSLFSMAGINMAYVTKMGKLIGVVGLEELRSVIIDVKNDCFRK